jgi:hypothetical protein
MLLQDARRESARMEVMAIKYFMVVSVPVRRLTMGIGSHHRFL